MQKLSLTTADGLTLPAVFHGAAQPRALLVVVHGLGEHQGRYAGFVSTANQADVSVITIDLRGHGDAPGESCRIESFEDYLQDLDALMAAAKDRAQEVPLFLMGHSLGGAIVLRWLAARPAQRTRIAGVILSSAALKIGRDVSPVLLKLAPLVAALAPGLRLQPIDPTLISRLPEAVAAYVADPKVAHRPPPARTANELLKAIVANRVAASALALPLYAFHGDADRLTDPEGSRELVASWGGQDKTLRLWAGSYHETMNDQDGPAVIREVLDWLLARAAAGSSNLTPTAQLA